MDLVEEKVTPVQNEHEKFIHQFVKEILEKVKSGEYTEEQGEALLSEKILEAGQLADRDLLTGLLNKRGFDNNTVPKLATLQRRGGRSTLLLVDVDFLKEVNDNLGHAQGSELLKDVATVLKASVRTGDLVARVGGDEFAILLEDADEAGGAEISKRVQESFVQVTRGKYSHLPTRPSLSIGMYQVSLPPTLDAQGNPRSVAPDLLKHSAEAAFRAADQALYQSKIYRNSVSIAHPDGTIITTLNEKTAIPLSGEHR